MNFTPFARDEAPSIPRSITAPLHFHPCAEQEGQTDPAERSAYQGLRIVPEQHVHAEQRQEECDEDSRHQPLRHAGSGHNRIVNSGIRTG